MATIQIIDDEPQFRLFLAHVLEKEGHVVLEAGSGPEGLALYESQRPDLVLCDVGLPGMDGITVLQRIKTINPAVPVIVMTGESTTERAIRAMSLGASDYLVKPFDVVRTLRTIRQILESLDHADLPNDGPPDDQLDGPALIGKSDAMYEVFKLIGRVAGQPSTVLILGESGTGKELVARAIHDHGPKRGGPFVALNCAAIPESLLESELFGHEKGAFTGADRQRPGKFEVACEGTLFLDEIGDMSPVVQAKLLRVLQDQEFYRIGGTTTVRTTARIVAATHRDLRSEATAGRFREDLFYRLSGVVIRLPPLRDRRDDVPLLAEHFLRRSARELRRPVQTISPEALDLLRAHDWPGNVRELANVIQQAVLQCPGSTVSQSQFAGLFPTPAGATLQTRPELFDPAAIHAHVLDRIARNDHQILSPLVAAYEQVVIAATLDHCQGNVSSAAKYLGLHRVTLKSRLSQFSQLVQPSPEDTAGQDRPVG